MGMLAIEGPADRLPPQHLEAERGVLGSCLLDNQVIDDIMEQMNLQPNDFYRDAHESTWGHILKLWNAGTPIDGQTISESLQRAGIYRRLGGDEFLESLVNSVPHAANGLYHAHIVRQKSINRKLMEAANTIITNGYSNQYTAGELLAMAEQNIFDISEQEIASGTLTAADVMADSLDRMRRRGQGEILGLSTQFPDLDNITGGMYPGQVTILAARPGQGKSALAFNIGEHVASTGVAVLVCSLEMPSAEIGDRLLSARSCVSGHKIRSSQWLNPRDQVQILEASKTIEAFPLFIDDNASRTTGQIAANARRLKRKHDLGLIVIDYLGLIDAPAGRSENRQEVVAGISRRLRVMARTLKVPILVLHQLNRAIENRDDKRPRMSDLRESGQIEADAHVIIFINRPETADPNDQPGIAELFVAKNRNGQSYVATKLMFVKDCMRFDSLARQSEQERPGVPY